MITIKKNDRSNLKRLQEITPKLVDLISASNGTRVDYNVCDGTCFGICLHQENGVSVQRFFISGGAIFPSHSHNQWEYGILYKGNVEVKDSSGASLNGDSDVIVIEPFKAHEIKALEDSWLILITVPADLEGYPSDK